MEAIVFILAAAIILAGASGVVVARNPVHSALSLVATLFGIAVLFVAQEAHFLAAVQVIVYAGAIVVLFLFVIMLLGVDQAEDLETEPLAGQRPAAMIIALAAFGLTLTAMLSGTEAITGQRAVTASIAAAVEDGTPNVEQLAELLFTDYLFAFEITSVLLVIAVVGAVVLSRRVPAADMIDEDTGADSPPDGDRETTA